MKTYEKIVLMALAIALVGSGVGWLSSSSTQQNSPTIDVLPMYENARYSVVNGTSMAPTFSDGDVVLWKEVDNIAELEVGDVIIFNHPTRPGRENISHRIVEIEGDRIWTAGDNSGEDRHPVTEEDIKGLVVGVIYEEN